MSRTLSAAVIAGVLGAAFAVAFGQTLARFSVHGLAILLTPAVAGLLYGPLVTAGGIPVVRRAFARDSPVAARAAGAHALAGGLTLGAGGSAGAEGPIIHLAAALGSALARVAAVPARPVAAAAVAGGISGSFGAPVTGVVLVVEVLLDGVAGLEFAAAVAGSAAGALTAHVLPVAPVRLPGATGTVDGLGILLAGLLAALAGVLLARSLEISRRLATRRWPTAGGWVAFSQARRKLTTIAGREGRGFGGLFRSGRLGKLLGSAGPAAFGGAGGFSGPEFVRRGAGRCSSIVRRIRARIAAVRNRRITHQPWWRPALGGLIAGPILLAIPGIGGPGPDLFAGVGATASGTLLLLAAGKIVTTSVTFAAGGAGGTIGPTLVVGAAVGAAVPVAGGAVAGVAACLAAAGRAPVTAVVLAVELGGLDLLPAILPAAALGRVVGGLLLRDTVFGAGARVDHR
ncbi:chloride channel protein [Amycolatopsis sp. NPDC048633]|uniref:chloride channel protein n=1 Tax=Amycolatopsis sp. NPDC048633 TaxID=3157095 RepID=UPI0033CDDD2A